MPVTAAEKSPALSTARFISLDNTRSASVSVSAPRSTIAAASAAAHALAPVPASASVPAPVPARTSPSAPTAVTRTSAAAGPVPAHKRSVPAPSPPVAHSPLSPSSPPTKTLAWGASSAPKPVPMSLLAVMESEREEQGTHLLSMRSCSPLSAAIIPELCAFASICYGFMCIVAIILFSRAQCSQTKHAST